MRRDKELLPTGVHMVAEKHAVFAITVVVEKCAPHGCSTPMVQRRHVELHDWMVIDGRNLSIQIFSRPDGVADMRMAMEMRTEILRQWQHLA